MTLDRIINMIISRVMRTVVNKGVDSAIDAVAGGRKKDERPSPEQQETKRRAKHAIRMARRAGRM